MADIFKLNLNLNNNVIGTDESQLLQKSFRFLLGKCRLIMD